MFRDELRSVLQTHREELAADQLKKLQAHREDVAADQLKKIEHVKLELLGISLGIAPAKFLPASLQQPPEQAPASGLLEQERKPSTLSVDFRRDMESFEKNVRAYIMEQLRNLRGEFMSAINAQSENSNPPLVHRSASDGSMQDLLRGFETCTSGLASKIMKLDNKLNAEAAEIRRFIIDIEKRFEPVAVRTSSRTGV